jgi:kynureninase
VPRDIEHRLRERGVVVDFREPDVIRAAPVPLYNSFEDTERFVSALAGVLGA